MSGCGTISSLPWSSRAGVCVHRRRWPVRPVRWRAIFKGNVANAPSHLLTGCHPTNDKWERSMVQKLQFRIRTPTHETASDCSKLESKFASMLNRRRSKMAPPWIWDSSFRTAVLWRQYIMLDQNEPNDKRQREEQGQGWIRLCGLVIAWQQPNCCVTASGEEKKYCACAHTSCPAHAQSSDSRLSFFRAWNNFQGLSLNKTPVCPQKTNIY